MPRESGFERGCCIPKRIPSLSDKKGGPASQPVPGKCPLEGGVWVCRRVARGDARIDPLLDLREQPRDPILAEPDPFREPSCRLQPRNVLRGIRNATHRFKLLLGYDLFFVPSHRTTPCQGASTLRLRQAAPVGNPK